MRKASRKNENAHPQEQEKKPLSVTSSDHTNKCFLLGVYIFLKAVDILIFLTKSG